MVAQVQRQASQFGSRMRATFPALNVFWKDPKPTNAPNYQRYITLLDSSTMGDSTTRTS